MRRILAVALGLVGAATAVVPAATAAPEKPQVVGELPVFVPQGQIAPQSSGYGNVLGLVVDPSRHRAFQLFRVQAFSVAAGRDGGNSTYITGYDTDTLERLGTVKVPGLLKGSGLHVVDQAHGRIFLQDWARDGDLRGLAVIQEDEFRDGNTAAIKYLAAPPAPYVDMGGLRYEPRTGKLLAQFNPERATTCCPGTQGNGPVYQNFVVQWNPDVSPGNLTQDWLQPLSKCAQSTLPLEVADTATPFLSNDQKAIFLPCGFGDGGIQLMRVPLDAQGKPALNAEEPVTNVGSVSMMLVDSVAERVHSGAGGANGAFIATYDGVPDRLIGTSVLSRALSISEVAGSLDPATGRLYFAVAKRDASVAQPTAEGGGLLMVDGRRAVLPQALAYRNVATDKPYGLEVESGTASHVPRVFILYEVPGKGPVWRVVSDPVPITSDPPGANAEPTQDIDEVPGKTDRAYAGEAAAYGLRWQAVGGVVRNDVVQTAFPSSCPSANRDILASYVQKTTLSPVAVAATAHPLAADLGTQADLRDVSRCRNQKLIGTQSLGNGPPPDNVAWPDQLKGYPGEEGWPIKPAECSGTAEHTSPAQYLEGAGSAHVTCGQDKETVKGEAEWRLYQQNGVSVGHEAANTNLYRDDKQGLVVESHARADNITIPAGTDTLTIGSVESTATSYSRGRVPKPGDKKRSMWTVILCGVRGPGIEEKGCIPSTDAGFTQLVNGLNTAFRGRLLIRQPKVDKELYDGTKMGYLAGVQRDRGEAGLAKIETGDDLLLVAGLEIELREADKPEVNRQILQFAGVRTVAAYGVFKLPDEVNQPFEPPAIDELPPGAVPAVTDFGGTGDITAPAVVNPAKAVNDVAGFVHRIAKAVAVGFGMLLRGPFESLVLFGLWATFGIPAYLLARRRRLGELT